MGGTLTRCPCLTKWEAPYGSLLNPASSLCSSREHEALSTKLIQRTTTAAPSLSQGADCWRTSWTEQTIVVVGQPASVLPEPKRSRKRVGPAFRACSTANAAREAAHPFGGSPCRSPLRRCRSSSLMIWARGSFARWYRARSSRSSSMGFGNRDRTRSQEQAPTNSWATVRAEEWSRCKAARDPGGAKSAMSPAGSMDLISLSVSGLAI